MSHDGVTTLLFWDIDGTLLTTGRAGILAWEAAASEAAGHPVDLPEEETLANALAGGIGLGNRHSFSLIRDLISTQVSVGEAEIANAMRHCVQRLRLIVEGGGAVALAALLSGAWRPEPGVGGPIVVVLSGGNVAPETLIDVLEGSH